MQSRLSIIRGVGHSRRFRLAQFFARVGGFAAILLSAAVLPVPAWANCKISTVALPVTISQWRPLVTASINNVDVNFVLDSGAFYSMISPASAEQFKLPLRQAPDGLRVYGVGGNAPVRVTHVSEFKLTKTVFRDIEFMVGGNEPGANAVGMLGQNFLASGDIEYDLGNGMVRLAYPGDDCRNANLAYWAKSDPYSEIDLDRGRMTSSKMTEAIAYVDDVKIRVLFDTGATSVLSLEAARRAGLVPGGPGVVPAGATHGIGRKEIQTWIAPVKSFSIGNEHISNTHLRIGNIDLTDVDMLIGMDFFLSHHIYVANGREKIYFTYNGGPVFDVLVRPAAVRTDAENPPAEGASPEAQAAEPTDAKGYAARGAALATRRDFQRALADLTRACELDPGVGAYFLRRGQIRLELSQQFLAMADFNEAIRLSPDDVDARLARARLHIAGRDTGSAVADLEAADKVAASQASSRLDMGNLYMRLDLPQAALGQYDLWIAAHEEDVGLKSVRNNRCWARALLGKELDKALEDCNAAVAAAPETAAYHDSRGLVYLRKGDLDKALDDYGWALRINPKIVWSLYGRGLIRLRKGEVDAGNADIAAAKVLRPSIAADAKRYGIE